MEQVRDDQIGVWLDATENPPEEWMEKYAAVFEDEIGITSATVWRWKPNFEEWGVRNYFLLPPIPESLPKCGVCGADVAVEYLRAAEIYEIHCTERSGHIQVHGATREKALSNYRRQRGEG